MTLRHPPIVELPPACRAQPGEFYFMTSVRPVTEIAL